MPLACKTCSEEGLEMQANDLPVSGEHFHPTAMEREREKERGYITHVLCAHCHKYIHTCTSMYMHIARDGAYVYMYPTDVYTLRWKCLC